MMALTLLRTLRRLNFTDLVLSNISRGYIFANTNIFDIYILRIACFPFFAWKYFYGFGEEVSHRVMVKSWL